MSEPHRQASTDVRIGVLTSGGDAPGMNAAVRAVVRAGVAAGAQVFAIREGWLGAVTGGKLIAPLGWDDVSGVLQRGGTIIGTARCEEFREADGRRRAVRNLVDAGIDRLVVIGGDGTLTGANQLRAEWPDHVAALLADGAISQRQADAHPALMLTGVVGSIDNDMVGTDMTIGTDSALHRITDAVDAIASTAASHQRIFIVEVMGRNCGYLALMGALAGGADYAFLPEDPPPADWPQRLCAMIGRAREAGRRDSIVVIAEGAIDRSGAPIDCEKVRAAIRENLGQDSRITTLGHVQRGGTPSAYDRWMATMVGVAATQDLLAADAETEPVIVGVRRNAIVRSPLMRSVEDTRRVAALVGEHRFDEARAVRGAGFERSLELFRTVSEADPTLAATPDSARIAVLNCGPLAPGMNTAAWAATRLGIDRGHVILGVADGFDGLLRGDVRQLRWGDVEGWNSRGGAALGTSARVPADDELPSLSETLAAHRIDALVVVGGFDAYEAVQRLRSRRDAHLALRIPIALLPASIDNDLPGWKMSIGADSALNAATEALDRVKQAASAHRTCFVVETMGRDCGFLALLSGLAAGAERIYLHEDEVHLASLAGDIAAIRAAFDAGRRFYLVVRNDTTGRPYPTDVLTGMIEAESGGRFGVASLTIGHVQQGPDPSPFDRMTATRLAGRAIDFLTEQLDAGGDAVAFPGDEVDGARMRALDEFVPLIDADHRRPAEPWWWPLRAMAETVSDRRDGMYKASSFPERHADCPDR